MVRPKLPVTKSVHVLIFGTIFLIILFFITYSLTQGVILRPENMIVHTNVVYYDGQFSDTNKIEDTKTALYVLNQSEEYVYATVFEYDKNRKEVSTAVQIAPRQNQFMKTNGPGVIYLINNNGTASSTIKFSRWATIKKYTIPIGFTF